MESLEESNPSRLSLLFLLVVGLDVEGEGETEFLVSESELFLNWGFDCSDDLHLSTSWVNDWVELVGDDGGVWLLVV